MAEYVLAGQYEQPNEPEKAENIPAAQLVHDAPVNGFWFWYFPATHAEQVPAAVMKLPNEQPHREEPADANVSEAQSLHLVAPDVAEYVLAGHAVHEAWPAALAKVPAAHATHDSAVEDARGWY